MVENKHPVMRFLSRKGLPLFEVVMVMIICSMAWVAYAGGLFSAGEMEKNKLNEHRMLLLKMCVQSYQWANNSCPPDLGALVCEGRDRTICIPVANPVLLKDPWGTPYQYRFSGRGFTLKSLGADKREGGSGPGADVTIDGP